MQKMFNNAMKARRAETMLNSEQLTLGEFILKLEAIKNKNLFVVFDDPKYYPLGFDSWRGNYDELMLEYESGISKTLCKDLLKKAIETKGRTFSGYKGGDYIMGKSTPIWVAQYGDSSGFKTTEEIYTQAVIDITETDNNVVIVTKNIEF